MNCFYHYELAACAQCKVCGKGLCKDCAVKYNGACNDCVALEANRIKKNFNNRKLFSIAIIFITMLWCFQAPMPPEYVALGIVVKLIFGFLLGFFFAGIPWGWSFIGKYFTGKYLLIMPIIGWVIYWGIKLLLSVYIGWLVLLCTIIDRYIIKKFFKKGLQ